MVDLASLAAIPKYLDNNECGSKEGNQSGDMWCDGQRLALGECVSRCYLFFSANHGADIVFVEME